MKKNSFTEAFYKNAGYFAVVLISLVYITGSLINISKTGKSIYEIIASGVLSLIVGIMINGVFRSIGIRKGDEDERTIATNALHAKTVDEISPYIDKLDGFCERENKRVLREVRTRILAKEGMKYSDYFDDDGNAINAECGMQNAKCISAISPSVLPMASHLYSVRHKGASMMEAGNAEWKMTPSVTPCVPPSSGRKAESGYDAHGVPLEKAKRRSYKRALHVRLKPLVSSNLTSDGVKANDPFDFGKSKKEYTGQKNASDIVIKLLMAIIFGYFGVSLASQINVASIIWNSLQIVLYVTGGVIQMYNSYMWIVDDYRGSVIKKIDYLQKFKNAMSEIDRS